jgi:hypothetical protein
MHGMCLYILLDTIRLDSLLHMDRQAYTGDLCVPLFSGAFANRVTHQCVNHFFDTPTKCSLYISTHTFYQISPICFGVLYTILRGNNVHLLKTVSFYKVIT